MTDAPVQGRLLGFDVREMWFTLEDLWNQQRRQVFLLRDDVTKPLSTDTLVWPFLIGRDP